MAKMDCVDNTGAKVVQLITVLKKGGVARRYPSAGVGDMIRVTVRRGTPETRRQIFNAVVVRQSDHSVELTELGYSSKTMLVSSRMNEGMSKGPISKVQLAGKRLSDGQELPLRQSRLCEV